VTPDRRGKMQHFCQSVGCSNGALGNTGFCSAHGGGRRCQSVGCSNGALGNTDFCSAHGGGRRCHSVDCFKAALGNTDFCSAHGSRCSAASCKRGV
jgi:hypothetical protein